METGLKSSIAVVAKRIMKLLKLDNVLKIINENIQKEYDKGLEEVEVKLDMNFSRNEKNLTALQDYTFDNIKGMTEEMANKLRQQIQQGLINMEPMSQIKNRVKDIMGIAENRAAMIARTESNRAMNFGRLDAAKESEEQGVEIKKWLLITNDDRTCAISKAMGKKYGSPQKAIPLEENFSVSVNGKVIEGPAPPFHQNERDRIMFTEI